MSEVIPSTMTASAAYTTSTDGPLSCMRDGGNSAADSFYATSSGTNTYIKFDFGSPQYVGHIDTACVYSGAPGGWGEAYTNGLLIEYSDDDSTWTTVGTISGHTNNNTATLVTKYIGYTARYWRFRRTSGYCALGECRFYDDYYALFSPRVSSIF